MFRVCRFVLTAAVAAGLVAFIGSAQAQPPFPKGKGGFEKKAEMIEKVEIAGTADAIKKVEAELARVKEVAADLEAKLTHLKEAAKVGGGGSGLGRPGFGPGVFGGGGDRGGPGGFGPGGLPIERMSPDQIKELIVHLQKVLEEKTRGENVKKPNPFATGQPDKPVKPGTPVKVKPGQPDKPGGVSQQEILDRLEKLTLQVEELRQAIKK